MPGFVQGGQKPNAKPSPLYEWSDLCRQLLLWLGLADPAACIFESINADSDREQLGIILLSWRDRFGNEAVLIRDALKRISFDDELWGFIRDIARDESSGGSVKWKAQVL